MALKWEGRLLIRIILASFIVVKVLTFIFNSLLCKQRKIVRASKDEPAGISISSNDFQFRFYRHVLTEEQDYRCNAFLSWFRNFIPEQPEGKE